MTISDIEQGRRSRGAINLFGECRVGRFEYFYMVVMVIYMAQMTGSTSRMVGSLSGNPIPLLLPMALTVVLLLRNHISWGCKHLWLLTGISGIWSVAILVKYNILGVTQEWSYYFFLYYAIFIAYIHVRVYGRTLFPLFEHIMVWLCKIAVVMWVLNILFYHTGIFNGLEETGLGRNLCYLYQWQTPDKWKSDTCSFTLRNAGCSWEPGRFAIMVLLASYVNLNRCGIRFRKNRGIWWLLAALFSTQSTTGYSIVLIMYALFYINRFTLKTSLGFFAIIIPVTVLMSRAEFMEEKITVQLQDVNETQSLYQAMEWNARHTYLEGEYAGSLDRFTSIFFEWQNLQNDPILGYGRNKNHSFFHKNVTTNYVLTGGIVKILAQYGIIFGLFIYSLLFVSSRRISRAQGQSRDYILLIVTLLSSISYPVWCTPVFTSFWLYGAFCRSPRGAALSQASHATVQAE